MSPRMPAVRPTPIHSTAAPATVASVAKVRPCAWEIRPEGRGRPAVRAMRASRSRSWTWLRADAPEDSSITPVSTTRPCPQGKSAPRGARSMKPAAAETGRRRTVPTLERPATAPARSPSPAAPSARATAPSALGGTSDSLDPRGRGDPGAARHLAPASGPHADPDHRAPERVAHHGMRGADRNREAGQDGGDAERYLRHGESEREGGGTGQRGTACSQRQMHEQSEQEDAKPP